MKRECEMVAITIKQIGDFVWFSERNTKKSYKNVIHALKTHISYITRKASAITGNVEDIIQKAKEELKTRWDSRVALKFYVAVPNDWDEEIALSSLKHFLKKQLNVPEENILMAFHQDNPENKHVHVVIYPRTTDGRKLRIGRKELQEFHKAWEERLRREGYLIYRLPEDLSLKKLPIHIIRKMKDVYQSWKEESKKYREALMMRHGGGLPDGKPESAFRQKQKSEIRKMIQGLGYSENSKVAVVCVHREAEPIQRIVRPEKLLEDRFLSFLQAMNSRGYNVYISVNELKENATNRKKESFKEFQKHIYLDIDGDKLGRKAEDILDEILSELNLPKPTLAIRTSEKNLQVVWTLTEDLHREEIERINSLIAERYGLDPTSDVSRVFRLPGFYNRKPGKDNYVYVVEKLSSFTPVSPSPFKDMLKETRIEEEKETHTKEKPSVFEEIFLEQYKALVVKALEEQLETRKIRESDVIRSELRSIQTRQYKSYSEVDEAIIYKMLKTLLTTASYSVPEAIRITYEIVKETISQVRPEKLEKSPHYVEISISNAYRFLTKEEISPKDIAEIVKPKPETTEDYDSLFYDHNNENNDLSL